MTNVGVPKKVMNVDSFDVLGVKVSAVNLSGAKDLIEHWVENKSKVYVCIAPVATIVDAQHDPKYREVINQAAMATPDGAPVALLGRLMGHKHVQRTYGPDVLKMVCEQGQTKGIRHFFYGGSLDSNKLLVVNLRKRFPKLEIAGIISPGFLDVGEFEKSDVINSINQANPDILWVGLGSPKQDYWMNNHRSLLNVPVVVGVGAAFDFIAGTKKQAPRWVQHSGFEWLFRLCLEPRRLWKRYLIGNTQFVFYLFINGIKSLFTPHAKN